ncbi:sensor histidine kinase, partial [Planobispora longispora]
MNRPRRPDPGAAASEERPFFLVTAVPYTLLAALVVFRTVIAEPSADDALLIDLGLCGLAAAWMLAMFTLRPGWWDRPRIMGVFFTGLLVIAAILVARDPAFGLFTPIPYIYAFTLLRWPWRLLGVAAVAVVAGAAQSSDLPRETASDLMLPLAVIAANVVLMGGTAWVLRRAEQERERREQTLAELSRTNRLLEASLAENAGLHAQLLAQAREAGVLDERQRMARE